MLRTIFRRPADDLPGRPMVDGRPPCVPPGVCVYAIGDIHGRADLLEDLHGQICDDAAHLTPGTDKLVVYMGDYVDRGLESREVLDQLVYEPLRGFDVVHILGNHDAWLLSFLVDASIGPNWLRYGGDATLHSYGVPLGGVTNDPNYYQHLQAELRSRIAREHVEFLQNLDLSYQVGDYFFVHAGVRPSIPLDKQHEDDLLWIREPFLTSGRDFGKIVVHGHTVDDRPMVRSNRIGIDTGACWTGCLTCLVLEEGNFRFMNTAGAKLAETSR